MLVTNGIFYSFDKVNFNARIGKYYESTNELNQDISTNEMDSFSYNATQTIYNNENFIESSNSNLWQIEIPKIDLKANISDGTTKEILDEFVGHFEDTQKDNGNIGLAAHNRGYQVNYFQNVKDLDIGDKIIYTYNGLQRTYIINLKTIIKETDWEFLKNTEDNRITLITCVENEPEYRRCIQAIEQREKMVYR